MKKKVITEEQFNEWKKEVDRLVKEMTEEAKSMIEDYVKNPSDTSGSVTQIHEDSPLLKEKKDVN